MFLFGSKDQLIAKVLDQKKKKGLQFLFYFLKTQYWTGVLIPKPLGSTHFFYEPKREQCTISE